MTDMSNGFFTEEQTLIRETARRVASEIVGPTAAQRDSESAWPRDELKALAELGFLGMLIPEQYGGTGAGVLDFCLAQHEISKVDAGLATIVHVHNFTALCIAEHGTDEQKQRYLPAMAAGKSIGAFLLTEPHAGSDTAALRTSARRDGDHFVLNGTKQFISNGSEAGVGVVFAITDKAAGKRGASTFLIDPSAPGYHVTRVESKLGQHTAHTAQIALEDYRVPAANLLGAQGDGYRTVMGGLCDGRIGIAFIAAGVAQAALDAAVKYAREREAYGAPLIALQGVAFDLADMAAQVDVAWQYCLHAARLRDAGVDCIKEASIAKLFASEIAEKVCSDALQIHGGYGYLTDFPVERYLRDVRITKIYEGTSHIQKLIISRHLG
ncbi:acyl-CoA dehydrogenase family protein [Paraburkholderia sabiae]|uniref:Acyl-CoA dehydrogenase family protein n=1 Tax=Paraburkholderia sabiae TaxID=273251 RepID=A0ABU9QC72_9BURK|nr:acyl-CoA dehydrogenase family protein [Paraburkholderia sabiae]WJZ75778.1 acyl-CoA dehydrogenase family protein [Paraburkholderia sabiae]CAD6561499.1 Acyl-CoA dehydrogenase [Paraburkholderia sabiae]